MSKFTIRFAFVVFATLGLFGVSSAQFFKDMGPAKAGTSSGISPVWAMISQKGVPVMTYQAGTNPKDPTPYAMNTGEGFTLTLRMDIYNDPNLRGATYSWLEVSTDKLSASGNSKDFKPVPVKKGRPELVLDLSKPLPENILLEARQQGRTVMVTYVKLNTQNLGSRDKKPAIWLRPVPAIQ